MKTLAIMFYGTSMTVVCLGFIWLVIFTIKLFIEDRKDKKEHPKHCRCNDHPFTVLKTYPEFYWVGYLMTFNGTNGIVYRLSNPELGLYPCGVRKCNNCGKVTDDIDALEYIISEVGKQSERLLTTNMCDIWDTLYEEGRKC